MGNTLSRTLIAVTASVVLAACSQMGNTKPPVATVRPAAPKDPWEAVKAELAPNGNSALWQQPNGQGYRLPRFWSELESERMPWS